jgi:hypothetical protein
MKGFEKWNVTTSLPSEFTVYDSELPHKELSLSMARSDFGDILKTNAGFLWGRDLLFLYSDTDDI